MFPSNSIRQDRHHPSSPIHTQQQQSPPLYPCNQLLPQSSKQPLVRRMLSTPLSSTRKIRPTNNHFTENTTTAISTTSSVTTSIALATVTTTGTASKHSTLPKEQKSGVSSTSSSSSSSKIVSSTTTNSNVTAILQHMEQLLYTKPVGMFVYPNDYIVSRNCMERMIQYHHQQQVQQNHHISNGSNRERNTVKESVDISLVTTTINTALQLLERNVKEYSLFLAANDGGSSGSGNGSPPLIPENPTTNNPSVLWFSRIQIINTIFQCWKDFAVLHLNNRSNQPYHHNRNNSSHNNNSHQNMDPNHYSRPIHSPIDGVVLLSPRQLVQSLETMSILLPNHFNYNITTMNCILSVLIQQAPTKQVAPIIGEQLLDFIRANESKQTATIPPQQQQAVVVGDDATTTAIIINPFHMTPTSETYAIVIQAWVDSGLPETRTKIDQLLQEFHGAIVGHATNNNHNHIAMTTTSPSPATSKISTNNLNETIEIANHQSNCMDGVEKTNDLTPYMMVMQYYCTLKNPNMVKNIYDTMAGNMVLQSHLNATNLSHILSFLIRNSSDYDLIEHIFNRITQLFITKKSSTNNATNQNHDNIVDPMVGHVLSKTSYKLMCYYRDRIMDVPKLPDLTLADYLRRSEYLHECTEHLLKSNNKVVGMY